MSKAQGKQAAGWITRFLTGLEKTGRVKHSARVAGKAYSTFLRRRNRDPSFKQAWDEALAAFETASAAPPPPPAAPPVKLGKRAAFLEALAETSSVSASVRRAGLTLREIYKLRRRDARFAAAWRGALLDGYDMLEMELLGYLRDPLPRHRMDVPSALRLLAAHRETVARQRALSEDEDEEAVLASIDRFIEEMRTRREANAALLIEHSPAPDASESDQTVSGEQGSEDDAAG